MPRTGVSALKSEAPVLRRQGFAAMGSFQDPGWVGLCQLSRGRKQLLLIKAASMLPQDVESVQHAVPVQRLFGILRSSEGLRKLPLPAARG